MEDHQKHMIQERQELNEKIINLTTFIFSSLVKIDKDEIALMRRQLYIMMEYSRVLDEQIDIFK